MTSKKKLCFVIMPITTPDDYLDRYRDGKDHFHHVLECYFVPSIEKAGFEVIRPIAEGSDVIPAEIIKNLEKADLVLCDMSCLNPNVFFEYGIRTALNKPICVVKDGLTPKVPFDVAFINYLEYNESLDPWKLKEAVVELADHLVTSHEHSDNENMLWKYFGIKSTADPHGNTTPIDEKLDYLALQVASLSSEVRESKSPKPKLSKRSFSHEFILEKIYDYLPTGVAVTALNEGEDNQVEIWLSDKISSDLALIVQGVLRQSGVDISINSPK